MTKRRYSNWNLLRLTCSIYDVGDACFPELVRHLSGDLVHSFFLDQGKDSGFCWGDYWTEFEDRSLRVLFSGVV